jgi:glyoxylase-like metal-dependent hydrolase (beta-lactamase superfamily II)
VPHASASSSSTPGYPVPSSRSLRELGRIGADWSDITDIVLTHKHFDHVAGLTDVISRAAVATVWAGPADGLDIPYEGSIEALDEGVGVRDLRVIATPGHTPGHRSLLHERAGLLFAGDVAGNMAGILTRGPEPFTEDPDVAEQSLRHVETLSWDRLVLSHGDEVADARSELRPLLAER